MEGMRAGFQVASASEGRASIRRQGKCVGEAQNANHPKDGNGVNGESHWVSMSARSHRYCDVRIMKVNAPLGPALVSRPLEDSPYRGIQAFANHGQSLDPSSISLRIGLRDNRSNRRPFSFCQIRPYFVGFLDSDRGEETFRSCRQKFDEVRIKLARHMDDNAARLPAPRRLETRSGKRAGFGRILLKRRENFRRARRPRPADLNRREDGRAFSGGSIRKTPSGRYAGVRPFRHEARRRGQIR